MSVERLLGLRLEACRFSRSSLSFEFAGRIGGEERDFWVSTSDAITADRTATPDALGDLTSIIAPFLEKTLARVVLDDSDESRRARFEFDDGTSFAIWRNEVAAGELLIISSVHTDEWFTLL